MTPFVPCQHLKQIIQDQTSPLKYNAVWDEYYIERLMMDSQDNISFCPFCGKKLPESKREQFFQEIERRGISYELGDDLGSLPEIFRTDAWWKMK